ncbi:MAG TPA: hypothetical protein VHO49_08265 [Anaerolineales bacterium]|nr:hypothetical protein [Anaerolineales bacterium]
MVKKFTLWTVLLVLSLFSAACAAQDTTNQEGDGTAVPVVTSDGSTATETSMTSTSTVEEVPPTQEAGDAGTTPTVSAEGAVTPEAGGTALIPQTGLGEAGVPDNLDELIRVVRATGASVDLGEAVELETVSIPGQTLLINGEEVQVFTYGSAEDLEAQASQLADEQDPESEPHFYKLGTMLVRYAGNDTLVRDLLEDVLGAQAAGQ